MSYSRTLVMSKIFWVSASCFLHSFTFVWRVYFSAILLLNVFRFFTVDCVKDRSLFCDKSFRPKGFIKCGVCGIKLEQIKSDFLGHDFLWYYVMKRLRIILALLCRRCHGLSCSLMYPIISSIKASELRVAGRLNSWLTKSSRLGVTTPLTVHCRLTTANISWWIFSHWPTNCFLFVLPMMPPALFCDLLIVCSRHISAPTAVNCPSVSFTTNFPALKVSNTDGASCASLIISSR